MSRSMQTPSWWPSSGRTSVRASSEPALVCCSALNDAMP
jgi:hypothetical protein